MKGRSSPSARHCDTSTDVFQGHDRKDRNYQFVASRKAWNRGALNHGGGKIAALGEIESGQ